jgi:hypothetical protein
MGDACPIAARAERKSTWTSISNVSSVMEGMVELLMSLADSRSEE